MARVTGGLNSSGRRIAALSREARCSRNTRSTANDSPVAMATGQSRKSSPRLLSGKGESSSPHRTVAPAAITTDWNNGPVSPPLAAMPGSISHYRSAGPIHRLEPGAVDFVQAVVCLLKPGDYHLQRPVVHRRSAGDDHHFHLPGSGLCRNAGLPLADPRQEGIVTTYYVIPKIHHFELAVG